MHSTSLSVAKIAPLPSRSTDPRHPRRIFRRIVAPRFQNALGSDGAAYNRSIDDSPILRMAERELRRFSTGSCSPSDDRRSANALAWFDTHKAAAAAAVAEGRTQELDRLLEIIGELSACGTPSMVDTLSTLQEKQQQEMGHATARGIQGSSSDSNANGSYDKALAFAHDNPEKEQLRRVIEQRERIRKIFESLDLHHRGRVTALELEEALARNPGVLGSLKYHTSPGVTSSTHVSKPSRLIIALT